MKKHINRTVIVSLLGLAVCLGFGGMSAQAATEGTKQLGEVLGSGAALGVSDPTESHAMLIGNADVDIEGGTVQFEVGGLGQSEQGSLQAGTMVQGHLVCNKAAGVHATVLSTPAVPVQENGTAQYSGALAFPSDCQDKSQLGFMIRVVSQNSHVDEL